MDLPIFCAKPSAPTNLTKHHGVDLQLPVGCGGVAVYPGDVLVGDGDGVIVIPVEIADEISQEAIKMEQFEDYVIEQVQAGAKVIGLYPPNDESLPKYNEHMNG
jgi:regulator of RNase E activity RraA